MTDGVGDGGIDWDAARQAEAELSRLNLYGFLGLLGGSHRHPETESSVIHLEDESIHAIGEDGNHSQITS
jgi:ssRNA-specific RNase YbeY (16S rRNA maturation enzyme)